MVKKMVAGLLLVVLVGGFLGVYYGNRVMDFFLLQMAGQVLGEDSGDDGTLPGSEVPGSDLPQDGKTNPDATTPGQGPSGAKENAAGEDGSLNPSGQAGGKDGGANTVLTPEALQRLQNGVSASDKLAATRIVLKAFNASELQRMLAMAKDGITAEETAEGMAMLRTRLSTQDVAALAELYQKYTR